MSSSQAFFRNRGPRLVTFVLREQYRRQGSGNENSENERLQTTPPPLGAGSSLLSFYAANPGQAIRSSWRIHEVLAKHTTCLARRRPARPLRRASRRDIRPQPPRWNAGPASTHRLDPVRGERVRRALADAAADRAIGGTCEIPESSERSHHLRTEMALLTKPESNQLIEVKLLGQVQRAQKVLLNADDDCIERARRHYGNVLKLFSNLILHEGPSQAAKAVRYLKLRQRIQQRPLA